MTIKPLTPQRIAISRIFVNLNNPRHDPVTYEGKAIEHLCEKENVYALARDIVKIGLNPLELFGLVPLDSKKTSKDNPAYYVAEGNRRFCAIKLLEDPDLAPPSQRKLFEKLAQKWTRLGSVNAVVFPTYNDARIWMERIHSGEQGGIGRKNWNADQKQRFDGGSKNRLALALLDYAEQQKMITATERQRKLTTAQRFIGNDVFRETLGLDQSDPEELQRTRPKVEFDTLLRRFVRDLVEGKDVHSRMNKSEIIAYARKFSDLQGVTSIRVPAEPLTSAPVTPSGDQKKKTRKSKPKPPTKVTHVTFHDEIYRALRTLGNEKLESLYHSICAIELDPHTPIVCIGTWSFFETLTACAGRNATTSFDSFLSKNKLTSYGIQSEGSTLRNAMERIRDYGNTTKHHQISATFNGEQLNNDMNTLKDVILCCITEAIDRRDS
ncbi:MAG: hypothetical protein AB1744_01360 [Candidatus Zixiibacteriota bacterium]